MKPGSTCGPLPSRGPDWTPITPKTGSLFHADQHIQRYCAKGHLDCLRQETPFGDKYLITPASVARHIAQIEELATTSGRGLSRPAATDVAAPERHEEKTPEPPTSPDVSRPVAPNYVERIESENDFLRQQIGVKDDQIKDLTERARETNHLIAGLQKMLTPLLSRSSDSRDAAPVNDDIRSG